MIVVVAVVIMTLIVRAVVRAVMALAVILLVVLVLAVLVRHLASCVLRSDNIGYASFNPFTPARQFLPTALPCRAPIPTGTEIFSGFFDCPYIRNCFIAH